MPSFCFDDFLLKHQKSDIASRSEISLSSNFGKAIMDMPIIMSPMDTLFSVKSANLLCRNGCVPLMPRKEYILPAIDETKLHKSQLKSASIGLWEPEKAYQFINMYKEEKGTNIFCVDVANGYNTHVVSLCSKLKAKFGDSITLISGNVSNREGFDYMVEYGGVDAVRVGVGSGSICSTRLKTGHGMPLASSLLDVSKSKNRFNAYVIADGGHKYKGDIAKSLACGADFVMLGSMLAGHEENPGDVSVINGNKYKVYRGMASKEVKGNNRHVEGIQKLIPFKGSLQDTLNDIRDSLTSAFSYTGARTLEEFQKKAELILCSTNSTVENNTHINFI